VAQQTDSGIPALMPKDGNVGQMIRTVRSWQREAVILAAVQLFAAAMMTWPLLANLRIAVADPGDPFINAWILDWVHHAIRSEATLFDANIFHPARGTLALSELDITIEFPNVSSCEAGL